MASKSQGSYVKKRARAQDAQGKKRDDLTKVSKGASVVVIEKLKANG